MPEGLMAFAGLWTIARRIDDRRAGLTGLFAGEVAFTPDAGGLVCEERGRLTYGTAPPFEATRRYLWRAAGPGRIEVLHADGRAFHAFALGAGAEAEHLCTPDLYRVAYDFSGWPRWRAVWTVRGPRKDYTSDSLYDPA